MKKTRMMIYILNRVILQWGKLKMKRQGKLKMKRHLMSPLMIFVRAIVDAHREAESVNEKWKLKGILEDYKKSCTQITKMATQSSIPHWS
jgi:hypothetical protein